MSDNATPENMSKLARLIAIGQPLNEQTVSETIDLCVTAWKADKAEMANMALARRANVILMQRLEAAEKALAMADVHIGWGDCTLENVHAIVRAALKEKP